jgi:cytochrome c oxidase subunit 2
MHRITKIVLGVGFMLALAGCSNSQNFLDSASPIADKEAGLYRLVLAMSVGVFVVVETLLIYNIIRFRQRRQQDDGKVPTQHYRKLLIEGIYTGIPVVLVVILFILTVRTIDAVAAPESSPSDLNVRVIAHQWWWEFDYPTLDITTANELHIPADTNVQVSLDSADVVHSFWVPQLAGKTDVIPGVTNKMWLRGDTPGVYDGQCAEYCGLNHATMRFKVFVDTQDDFATWVSDQQRPPAQPHTDLQQQGYNIIVNGICSNCHTLGSHQGAASIGPNLTHLFTRTTFAGASFELNQDNVRRWLQDTQAMKPGNKMKNVSLSPDQIDALVAYLSTLD